MEMGFAKYIQKAREEKELTLQALSKLINIDAAILSKIETKQRVATRKQVLQLIDFYSLDEEKAFSLWLADKILNALKNEEYAQQALHLAEERAPYLKPEIINLNFSTKIKGLIQEVDKLKAKWESCKPLNKTQLKKMREYFELTYTYDSNQIEGNTLTYQETHLVVNEGVTIGGKSMREHLEAINHYEAVEFIIDIVRNNESINERVLKEVHYLILKGIDRKNAGVYRKVPVKIGGSSHVPPEHFLLDSKMSEVFDFYIANKNKVHPVILAADMHEKIVTVHPFIDGNGRTSRLIMNLILLNSGFTIASLKGNRNDRLNYYAALEDVQINNNSEKFYILILETVKQSLEEHIQLAG